MRVSISAKIFVGFLVVLATSASVATYGALAMRRLGDELRLVSRGYLELRLQVSEMQTVQGNLLRVMTDQMAKLDAHEATSARMPRFFKLGLDEARRTRLEREMPRALAHLGTIEARRASAEEHALLHQIRRRLEGVAAQFRADEELFDRVYGPIGEAVAHEPSPAEVTETRTAADKLLRRERGVYRDLTHLAAELRLRAEEAGLRLEESENRAVWATMLLAVFCAAVGVVVMLLVTRAVRPLRRLAERAKEVARGDYRQRVDASSGDEVGALGREFNAMAAALEEREARLIRSERLAAVGKIAAQITHEVRNPLSSIGLNAELLEETVAAMGPEGDRAEALALTRAIVKEVDRLTDVTEAYLRFARLPRPRLEREDLRDLVGALLAFLAPELSARGIAVESTLPATLPPIAGDENQLRQALLNLLRNAAEAMAEAPPGSARLRLSAAALPDGAQLELTVSDTGQGIAAEHLAKIFDPFFSTKEHGTGLGLALTQQIVVDHGGAITVESTPGQGTTFRVRLPIWREEPEGAPPPAPPASPDSTESAPLAPPPATDAPPDGAKPAILAVGVARKA